VGIIAGLLGQHGQRLLSLRIDDTLMLFKVPGMCSQPGEKGSVVKSHRGRAAVMGNESRSQHPIGANH
jgi:hypothetical protein